jgi:hypothetical protein
MSLIDYGWRQETLSIALQDKTKEEKEARKQVWPEQAGTGLDKRKSKGRLGRGRAIAPVSGWIFFRCWNGLVHGQ